ncbi:hypothetical protein RXV94_12670 [Yeosuana sp. MJ-SS3]|uniref:Uncharacterized protein n=1 Tax=Gilvirhabdus luticola TaxID=3079858 RepID=A0ABU3U9F0_9FLAO|nr:hypothetical protein [Yeosuana sp. MJ-SS3]MDU8887015.1 hypothetical protein [Yeosuana sp. MJ-SS3]
MKRLKISLIILCCTFASNGFSQSGYQKDSLQIKVYTEIEYVERLVKDITVKKVFCDYCSEFQTEQIKKEAIRRSYLVRNDVDIRLENGIYRHALYIRISKKDFSEMKKESTQENINN